VLVACERHARPHRAPGVAAAQNAEASSGAGSQWRIVMVMVKPLARATGEGATGEGASKCPC
jgi:hypothetical protein